MKKTLKTLTTKQKIELLEFILRDDTSLLFPYGICYTIIAVAYDRYNIFSLTREVVDCFPMFTRENAIKHANAKACNGAYWWPLVDVENRITFIKWVLDELKQI